METDNVPTVGEWLQKLPHWKRILFLLWHENIPLVSQWALVAFGYTRAKRIPTLPREARIRWNGENGQRLEEEREETDNPGRPQDDLVGENQDL